MLPGVEAPTLIVTKGHPFERLTERFLIGDEDSVLHKKAVLQV